MLVDYVIGEASVAVSSWAFGEVKGYTQIFQEGGSQYP